jgi:glycosyltransferase involved in cell wall biosynthesis
MDRLAYIKFNDVVVEMQGITTYQRSKVSNGPLNYIVNFLQWADQRESLVISFDSLDNKTKTFKSRNVTAKTIGNTLKKKCFGSQLCNFLQTMFEIFCVFNLLRSFKPTWILCARAKGALIGCYLYATFFKTPIVITRHGSVDIRKKKKLVKFLSKLTFFLIKKAKAVICHGPYLRDQLLSQNIDHNKIIEFNLSYSNLLLQQKSEKTVTNKAILYLGRLYESKGAIDIFNACEKLLHDCENVKLVYAGDGDCFAKLKEMAESHNLKEKVTLLGFVEHFKIREIIEASSFLVIPTKSISDEGRPKSAIEALVLGRPVIAPDFGSFKYLIKDGYNGLLYEPDNISDLYFKIKSLINDNELYELLKKGAAQSSKEFLSPKISFTEALRNSFTMSNK